MKFLLAYLTLINAVSFLLMHIDKQKARKNKWRIRESTLLLSAALGGSIGSLLGMYLFRHKTQHPKFTIGVPVILTVQIVAALLIVLL